MKPHVTTAIEQELARQHGRGALNGDFKVLSKAVHVDELFTDGNSILEWGYVRGMP